MKGSLNSAYAYGTRAEYCDGEERSRWHQQREIDENLDAPCLHLRLQNHSVLKWEERAVWSN